MEDREPRNSSLEEYRRKRDFTRTPEPSGEGEKPAANIFVVQKHSASHLHYDFRLQLHGSLKSWAIPKGPSLDPTQPRLAQQTEDHPLEYASFEGVIPAGEYGAGTVLVWDMGEWEPVGEGRQGFYHGRLSFILYGQRLAGKWSLVRQEQRAWMLVKEMDEHASVEDILTHDTSVISGRTLEEIAQSRESVWTREQGLLPQDTLSVLGHRPGGNLPEMIAPQLATLDDQVPEGDDWLHEIKYDGYRIVCRINKEQGSIRFFTRKAIDLTDRLKPLRQAVSHLPVSQAWLDGEIVVLTQEGKADFNALQNSFTQSREARPNLSYLVFDLMNYEGYDLRAAPLVERKALLADLIPKSGPVRYVDHVIGQGKAFFDQACDLKLEGIVSKQTDSSYTSERTRSWLKIKCAQRQEFVVGGYTESGAGRLFGSLLAGYYDQGNRLVFCGKIKTGYSSALSRRLLDAMQQYEQPDPPFVNPPSGVEYRNPHWLKPELIAEAEFTEITGTTGLLRHASFKGLRQDKNAKEIRLERPTITAAESLSGKKPEESRQQIVYPHERITRQMIHAYYSLVSERMLPHLRNRPLTLIVCPTNIYACKFTKHATKFSAPVKAIEAGHEEKYIAIDSAEGLMALVDAGTVEFHGWQSRYTDLEHPDRLLFDLDPPEDYVWERLAEAALLLRIYLQKRGLESFIQTSGGKGYYVVVPLIAEKKWRSVTSFAKGAAEELEQLYPARLTAKLDKNERHGRIYMDWIRNGRGAHAADPYSLRARPGATIATPITWEELAAGTRPDAFNLLNIRERLKTQQAEPWRDYFDLRQVLAT